MISFRDQQQGRKAKEYLRERNLLFKGACQPIQTDIPVNINNYTTTTTFTNNTSSTASNVSSSVHRSRASIPESDQKSLWTAVGSYPNDYARNDNNNNNSSNNNNLNTSKSMINFQINSNHNNTTAVQMMKEQQQIIQQDVQQQQQQVQTLQQHQQTGSSSAAAAVTSLPFNKENRTPSQMSHQFISTTSSNTSNGDKIGMQQLTQSSQQQQQQQLPQTKTAQTTTNSTTPAPPPLASERHQKPQLMFSQQRESLFASQSSSSQQQQQPSQSVSQSSSSSFHQRSSWNSNNNSNNNNSFQNYQQQFHQQQQQQQQQQPIQPEHSLKADQSAERHNMIKKTEDYQIRQRGGTSRITNNTNNSKQGSVQSRQKSQHQIITSSRSPSARALQQQQQQQLLGQQQATQLSASKNQSNQSTNNNNNIAQSSDTTNSNNSSHNTLLYTKTSPKPSSLSTKNSIIASAHPITNQTSSTTMSQQPKKNNVSVTFDSTTINTINNNAASQSQKRHSSQIGNTSSSNNSSSYNTHQTQLSEQAYHDSNDCCDEELVSLQHSQVLSQQKYHHSSEGNNQQQIQPFQLSNTSNSNNIAPSRFLQGSQSTASIFLLMSGQTGNGSSTSKTERVTLSKHSNNSTPGNNINNANTPILQLQEFSQSRATLSQIIQQQQQTLSNSTNNSNSTHAAQLSKSQFLLTQPLASSSTSQQQEQQQQSVGSSSFQSNSNKQQPSHSNSNSNNNYFYNLNHSSNSNTTNNSTEIHYHNPPPNYTGTLDDWLNSHRSVVVVGSQAQGNNSISYHPLVQSIIHTPQVPAAIEQSSQPAMNIHNVPAMLLKSSGISKHANTSATASTTPVRSGTHVSFHSHHQVSELSQVPQSQQNSSKKVHQHSLESLALELAAERKEKIEIIKEKDRLQWMINELETTNKTIRDNANRNEESPSANGTNTSNTTTTTSNHYLKEKLAESERRSKELEAEYAANSRVYKEAIQKSTEVFSRFEALKNEKEEAVKDCEMLRAQLLGSQLELQRVKLQTLNIQQESDDVKNKMENLADVLRQTQQELIVVKAAQSQQGKGGDNKGEMASNGQKNDDSARGQEDQGETQSVVEEIAMLKMEREQHVQKIAELKDGIRRMEGSKKEKELDEMAVVQVKKELEETKINLLKQTKIAEQALDDSQKYKKNLDECNQELGEVFRLMNQKKREADLAQRELRESQLSRGGDRAMQTELLCLRETYENVTCELDRSLKQLEFERKEKETVLQELHVRKREVIELYSMLEMQNIKYDDLKQQQQQYSPENIQGSTRHSRVLTKMTYSTAQMSVENYDNLGTAEEGKNRGNNSKMQGLRSSQMEEEREQQLQQQYQQQAYGQQQQDIKQEQNEQGEVQQQANTPTKEP